MTYPLQGTYISHIQIQNIRQFPFFFENALKKTTEYFLKFLFLFQSTILSINNGK